MIRRPPRSTLFPYTPSSDLAPPRKLEVDRTTCKAAHRSVTTATDTPSCWERRIDRKSTRLNSSHLVISYAVFCLKKKKKLKCHYTRAPSNDIARPLTCYAEK